MNYLTTLAKLIFCALEAVFVFICLYFVVFSLGMIIPVNSCYSYNRDDIQFYVISNGVHTDICLPVVTNQIDWRDIVPIHDYSTINFIPKYISIGWGDKGFYLNTPEWSDLTISTAFNAVFLPSETAMHVTYMQSTPLISSRVELCSMPIENYHLLIHFIKDSFINSSEKASILIPDRGYTRFDNFFEGRGKYFMFYTCNTWTNQALKVAGVKTSSLALSESGIMRWL